MAVEHVAHRLPHDAEFTRGVAHLHAQHELHGAQVGDDRIGVTGLGDDPRARAVIDHVQLVLDVAVGAQDERESRLPRRQVLQLSGGETVQPRQAIGSGDGHDAVVRQVDAAPPLREHPLLGERLSVVPCHPGVG